MLAIVEASGCSARTPSRIAARAYSVAAAAAGRRGREDLSRPDVRRDRVENPRRRSPRGHRRSRPVREHRRARAARRRSEQRGELLQREWRCRAHRRRAGRGCTQSACGRCAGHARGRRADAERRRNDTFTEYFRRTRDTTIRYRSTTTHTVRVRTDLYLVDSQARVWGVESTAVEKPNLFGVIDGIAKAVTAQLRSDGLIRYADHGPACRSVGVAWTPLRPASSARNAESMPRRLIFPSWQAYS